TFSASSGNCLAQVLSRSCQSFENAAKSELEEPSLACPGKRLLSSQTGSNRI
ncbi:13340_t:CDS:2, partial [Funneliformis geosporum]